MIDLQTINEEISRLESSKASYPVCEKLADLYIVRDHMGGGSTKYGRNMSDYGYYERGGNSGNYGMYGMMEDEMGMGRSRMSMPSMR